MRVLVANDKYGVSLYIDAMTLLRMRLDQGYWYEGEAFEKARQALADGEKAANAFLNSRRDYEYEDVEWLTVIGEVNYA